MKDRLDWIYCQIFYSQSFHNLSTTHALTDVTTTISESLNQRKGAIIVSLDTEKAFDTACIEGEIYKMLKTQKFEIHLCKLVHNYLDNRAFSLSTKVTKNQL